MDRLRVLLTFGTRPEAIKMAPIVHECQKRSARIELFVCVTGQHRQMLDSVVQYFGLPVDRDLELMVPDQTLAELSAHCLTGLDAAIVDYRPDCVVAQGDTTTVMAASLAAFYRRVPLVHVEAGLRTGDVYAPWPEEVNRRVASMTAALHCAPTPWAAENLLREGASPETVHVTGNTVVDALLWTVARERRRGASWRRRFHYLGSRRMVLVTSHRRENFGDGLEQICRAVARLAERFPEVEFVYPVHLNPHVREPVHRLLSGRSNVHLCPPASYPEFVWLMDRSTLILTDSGGVQEEAPSLRKPVLVMRETTERPEAVEGGGVELVGADVRKIVGRTSLLLTDAAAYAAHQIDANPYGDGSAAQWIVELMLRQGWRQQSPAAAARSPRKRAASVLSHRGD
ncbi:MAG: UDP-N-acetylglucosamine 2-epimerase (non-hydrolyzing) [Pirellulales bacterium]|nr:UDP-N-acetylglucosamine 2-epimerase (non-hydrolyzing) [Pirellulales bacterium]